MVVLTVGVLIYSIGGILNFFVDAKNLLARTVN